MMFILEVEETSSSVMDSGAPYRVWRRSTESKRNLSVEVFPYCKTAMDRERVEDNRG